MIRPKVVLFGDSSIDGRITTAPGVLLMFPEERWQAVSPPSEVFEWIKTTYKPQSYLEGSLSFLPEGVDPAPLPPYVGDPAPLYDDFLPEKIVKRPGHVGWFTVVDSRGRVRWEYKEFPDEAWKGWYALSLVSHSTPPEHLAFLQSEDVPYLVAGDNQVDLSLALEKMNKRLGVERVLSTSPGKLGGALARSGLVDEINLDFFPAVIGGTRTPSLFMSPDLQPGEMPVRLKLLSAQAQASGRVWLRYEVVDTK